MGTALLFTKGEREGSHILPFPVYLLYSPSDSFRMFITFLIHSSLTASFLEYLPMPSGENLKNPRLWRLNKGNTSTFSSPFSQPPTTVGCYQILGPSAFRSYIWCFFFLSTPTSLSVGSSIDHGRPDTRRIPFFGIHFPSPSLVNSKCLGTPGISQFFPPAGVPYQRHFFPPRSSTVT